MEELLRILERQAQLLDLRSFLLVEGSGGSLTLEHRLSGLSFWIQGFYALLSHVI